MTITAKFAGTCTRCHAAIVPGQSISWERGKGSTHADADLCRAQEEARAILENTSDDDGTFPAVAPKPKLSRPVVNLSALVAFLRAARDRGLKFPKTRFAAPGNGELAISLAGDTSRNPGAVYVKLNGEYVGKVTAEGVAYGLDALLPTLRAIEADPAAAGAAYGALTGRCSFCEKKLDDEGSLAVGYGPVCAKRYGLPHTPKGSAASVPVVHDAQATADALRACTGAVRVTVTDGPVVATSPLDHDGTEDYNLIAAREARYAAYEPL